jgi:Lipoprotein signal peptidase
MILMLLVLAGVVSVDQLAKRMIASRLEEGAVTSANIFGVRLRHVVNRRKPWGSATAVRIMAIAWLVAGATVFLVPDLIDSQSMFIALGALLGGALGNLLDGLSRNGVTDFIDLRVWPVFNIADTAITAGAMLFLWNAIRLRAGV